uniref:Basic proline-rich protein-like n=1 Tax=Phascolarctos cinereus TaxID=38626 RepID=A0A6P5JQK5_PHACI|nr:basic proline-rich protein-like [Phascolarctos cinereus]
MGCGQSEDTSESPFLPLPGRVPWEGHPKPPPSIPPTRERKKTIRGGSVAPLFAALPLTGRTAEGTRGGWRHERKPPPAQARRAWSGLAPAPHPGGSAARPRRGHPRRAPRSSAAAAPGPPPAPLPAGPAAPGRAVPALLPRALPPPLRGSPGLRRRRRSEPPAPPMATHSQPSDVSGHTDRPRHCGDTASRRRRRHRRRLRQPGGGAAGEGGGAGRAAVRARPPAPAFYCGSGPAPRSPPGAPPTPGRARPAPLLPPPPAGLPGPRGPARCLAGWRASLSAVRPEQTGCSLPPLPARRGCGGGAEPAVCDPPRGGPEPDRGAPLPQGQGSPSRRPCEPPAPPPPGVPVSPLSEEAGGNPWPRAAFPNNPPDAPVSPLPGDVGGAFAPEKGQLFLTPPRCPCKSSIGEVRDAPSRGRHPPPSAPVSQETAGTSSPTHPPPLRALPGPLHRMVRNTLPPAENSICSPSPFVLPSPLLERSGTNPSPWQHLPSHPPNPPPASPPRYSESPEWGDRGASSPPQKTTSAPADGSPAPTLPLAAPGPPPTPRPLDSCPGTGRAPRLLA